MSYVFGGYLHELEVIDAVGRYRLNLALSTAAFMLGTSDLVKDPDLKRWSRDFWAEEQRLFGNSVHRFRCKDENPPQIDLGWWCGRWLVAHEISVEFQADDSKTVYRFSEETTLAPSRNLIITLQNSRDLRRSRWGAVVNEIDLNGSLVQKFTLPDISRHEDDDLTRLFTNIQDGLAGTSYIGAPNE